MRLEMVVNSEDVEVYSDGDGLAVFGEESQVEAFLQRWQADLIANFPKRQINSGIQKLSLGMNGAGQIQAASGRWVKMTTESATQLNKYGPSLSKKNGLMCGVVRNPKGQIVKHIQFEPLASASLNPAMLMGVGGVLAQAAAELQMRDIANHLESIEQKLDYVLKDLKGSLFAELEGASAAIDKAMVLRKETGRVNEVTWSQVQGVQSSIYLIQSKALRRLMNLADTIDEDESVVDRLDAIGGVEGELTDLLAALSETFRLQDAFYIVELDRVMETEVADLESHREAIQRSRRERVAKVTEVTTQLLERIYAAGRVTRTERLRMLKKPEVLIAKCNSAAGEIVQTQVVLGADTKLKELESQSWTDALREVRDGALTTTRRWGESAAGGISDAKEDFNDKRAQRIRKKLEKIEGKKRAKDSSEASAQGLSSPQVGKSSGKKDRARNPEPGNPSEFKDAGDTENQTLGEGDSRALGFES